jgi:hypothetical protein
MAVSLGAVTASTLPGEDRIQTSSIDLERRVEPWCPGDCTVGVPFVPATGKD